MKKVSWHKDKILAGIFIGIFLISFLLLCTINIPPSYKDDSLLFSMQIVYYLFPMAIVSGTFLMLLIAKCFLGLKVNTNNILKWVLGVILILIGIWYLLLINNFHGPITDLPEIITSSKILTISILQKYVFTSLLTYKGTILLQGYGICLYMILV